MTEAREPNSGTIYLVSTPIKSSLLKFVVQGLIGFSLDPRVESRCREILILPPTNGPHGWAIDLLTGVSRDNFGLRGQVAIVFSGPFSPNPKYGGIIGGILIFSIENLSD